MKMTKKPLYIDYRRLEKLAYDILLKGGLSEMEAQETATHLVRANLRGVDSHGITRVPIYLKRLHVGVVRAKADVSIIHETPVSAYIDGNNGIGPYIARKTTEIAIEKAKKSGVAIVGLTNANHLGTLGYYSELAVNEGLITFITANAPANMPPFGGAEKYFGTNPFSYGFPTGREKPFILDMATSVVSKGKIILAMKNNENIPLGWAIDKNGQETTNAQEAVDGLVLPLGGPKGYGLAFMVDILSGIMTGSNWGPHINDLYSNFTEPQNVGMFAIVLRPDLFISEVEFKKKIDQAISEVRNLKLQKGFDRIYIPGEIETITLEKRRSEGVPLTIETVTELERLGKELEVNVDFLTDLIQMA
ncbi:Ldh family oxidoreductase [Alkalihalobacillus oceani]|uniref:Ldh family oxidoreductase n=1 Tax=Halalkalibacter oceani TaxID=1653776 RepID=A0A9X2DQK0_9BACI|nr:Ldh family oxidoreductase [Halalkalibacter oceani]MCM3714330.1 Ldh family oxidoreductase [Halalkalibacter oceani]